MMDTIIRSAGKDGVKDVVIGMAHRGRLNVLVNTLGKNPRKLFDEFEGKFEHDEHASAGDVKYHMGFSADVATEGARCTWRWRSTRRTWKSPTRSWPVPCVRARSAARTPPASR